MALDSDSSDICFPLTNIDNVLNWKCDGKCWIHKHNVAEIRKRSIFMNSGYSLDTRNKSDVYTEYKWSSDMLPKTIFCHDYCGGYVEDKFCNGSPNINTYRFFNWAGIDIFIYFSHHLVTIPTQGWLNAGHTHGVPVLGTLITENEDGNAIWMKILSDNIKTITFAQKLAEICAHFKFDGYLLNIENEIPKELVPKLIQFVMLLKAKLNLFCEKQTWLIWYDSVTTEGDLSWQNKLCPLNKPFFDACDGIFLNYNWTPGNLLESVALAGPRKFDVFVGVDVYGRNCYQDGGFNVDKALAVIRTQNMSTAIFAPGWSFEKLPKGEDFLPREIYFWKLIFPYLYIHGPAELPFSTNFCQGICSSNENGDSLFNMGIQEQQPTAQACSAYPSNEKSCISLCLEDGILNKGSCLKITEGSPGHSKIFHRVFACDFEAPEDKALMLQVTLSLKSGSDSQASEFRIFFILEDKLSIEGKQRVSMQKRPKGCRASTRVDKLLVAGSLIDFTAERQTIDHKIKLLKISDVESSGWQEIKFLVKVNAGASLTEILLLPPHQGSVLWGFLEIKELDNHEVKDTKLTVRTLVKERRKSSGIIVTSAS